MFYIMTLLFFRSIFDRLTWTGPQGWITLKQRELFITSCTFGFFPNSQSLFLVLLMGCFGSDRGPGAPSRSRSLSPLGVLLMVPSEPVLLKFWLKSSKGKSAGGSKPDLNDSTTIAESWEVRRKISFPIFIQTPTPRLDYYRLIGFTDFWRC